MIEPVFLYDFNSPYAYLAAQRVDDVLPGPPIWRPIAFGVLIRRIGKTPWSLSDPATVEAGQRECERRASDLGLPPIRWPQGWPDGTYSLAVLRAAIVAERQGLLRPFTHAAFRRTFAEGQDLRGVDAVAEVAIEAGVDEPAVRAGVEDPEVKAVLRERTDRAIADGVTGVPTIVLPGGEQFWGDDRLEDAARAAAAA